MSQSHHRPGAMKRVGSRRRTVSGLGIILVLIGLLVLAVNFSLLPRFVYELWPLIIVAIGVFGLVRRPGWIDEIDVLVPGAGEAVSRPRRRGSLVLISAGLVLLLFSLHLVDERVIGPALLIGLGALLLWRRTR
ncbi:MAG: hypothetical protein E6I70_12940 [Chloroflexi bacterium]|nr:MAG: hypothetical protein E6I63_11990 [Chloroflexota bacterium]TME16013.1 MAG: hypothetical protein E6I70_12940 [Chloroflexota bacterium]